MNDIDYGEIRAECEEGGWKVNDREFDSLVAFARRKANLTGKDENYLLYLLPDVIREYFFRKAVNAVGMAMLGVTY